MDLPAEPEEQHEREGKGGGKARARDRAQERHSEQDAGGCDQGVAQDEIGERSWTNDLLHAPQQPFVERRVAQLISAGEMALQELGGERVLQGPPRRHRPEHQHEGQGPEQPEGRHPACRQHLAGKLRHPTLIVRPRPLYTAADKRPALAYKGAHAEAVRPKSPATKWPENWPAKDWLCQPGLPQGAGRFGAHHHQAARRRLRAVVRAMRAPTPWWSTLAAFSIAPRRSCLRRSAKPWPRTARSSSPAALASSPTASARRIQACSPSPARINMRRWWRRCTRRCRARTIPSSICSRRKASGSRRATTPI